MEQTFSFIMSSSKQEVLHLQHMLSALKTVYSTLIDYYQVDPYFGDRLFRRTEYKCMYKVDMRIVKNRI
jgi:hypothetical protein